MSLRDAITAVWFCAWLMSVISAIAFLLFVLVAGNFLFAMIALYAAVISLLVARAALAVLKENE